MASIAMGFKRLQCAVFLLFSVCVLDSARAEQFELESAVMDSVSGKNLGVANEKGAMSDFFKAQKSMMYGILRSSGIELESLPPEIRKKLERFQTTNLAAFKAFSQGLDLKDAGKFAEAQSFFQKAVELDPGFKFADEMKISMPNVNLPNLLQIGTVIRDNARTSVDSGKKMVEVDISRATAALMAGQTVVVGSRDSSVDSDKSTTAGSDGFTTNPPGSGAEYAPRKVIGVSFNYAANSGAATNTAGSVATNVSLASTNEWTAGQFQATGGSLQSVGLGTDFVANREGAAECCVSLHTLADGTAVYWGTWKSAPGASATVTVSGASLSAPVLGNDFLYMMGDATRSMPTSGSVVFKPVGGFMNNVAGDISVNFVTRQVNLNDLGFSLGGLSFSQLNGAATFDANVASGFYKGNYSTGTCVGCSAFSPGSSAFVGNFVGKAADGTVLSNIMQTGTGTVSGVHLFALPRR